MTSKKLPKPIKKGRKRIVVFPIYTDEDGNFAVPTPKYVLSEDWKKGKCKICGVETNPPIDAPILCYKCILAEKLLRNSKKSET